MSKTNEWLTVSYQPVSLFTLKRSDATNMAAKSNLVPTPYTIKMALLKMMLENFGKHHANDFAKWIKKEFAWIRDLQIYIQPPERIIVNRNGYKLRYYDQTTDKADKIRPTLAMQDGFVFREWVFLEGELQLCLGPTQRLAELETLLSQINYFGKRSCFFQYLSDHTFSSIEPQLQSTFDQGFILQPLDDMGKTTTFDKINPFSSERAILNKDRIPTIGFLPLRLIETSTRYDFYERY